MNRFSYALGIVLVLALSGICTVVALAQEAPLTNAEIVKLTKLEMGDAVIIAKIKAAKEVQFDTGTDELVKLREAGVSKDVIAAMIERTAPPPAKAGGPSLKVQLESAEGVTDVGPLYGVVKTMRTIWATQSWVQVVDLEAKIRTRDRRPAILLSLDRDPRGGWWLVQLSQQRKENYRYFDHEGGGNPFAQTFSGTPEKGSIVPYEIAEERPGLWRIRPLKDLKPGEYGLFAGTDQFMFSSVEGSIGGYAKGAAGIVFGFGIDK